MSDAQDPAGPDAEDRTAEAAMPDAGQTEETSKEPLPVTMADYRATAGLLMAFLIVQALAVLFARPFVDADIVVFEDPDKVSNSLWYFALLIAFTALILYIAKKGKQWMIQAIILLAVGSTVMYVVAPLLLYFGMELYTSWGLGAVLGGGSVLWLYKNPEWYVVDFVGILVAAGAAAIFGVNLSIVPVMVLLIALAIYDAIAVYKTKHMLSLADSVIDLRLPVLLVIPKTKGYSFLHESSKFKEANPDNKDEREAFFMGLGDLVMPTILVVSALQFGAGTLAVLGAAIGTLVGFAVLMAYVLRGNPQAGLPLLNGGAIVGFLAGWYWTHGDLLGWL